MIQKRVRFNLPQPQNENAELRKLRDVLVNAVGGQELLKRKRVGDPRLDQLLDDAHLLQWRGEFEAALVLYYRASKLQPRNKECIHGIQHCKAAIMMALGTGEKRPPVAQRPASASPRGKGWRSTQHPLTGHTTSDTRLGGHGDSPRRTKPIVKGLKITEDKEVIKSIEKERKSDSAERSFVKYRLQLEADVRNMEASFKSRGITEVLSLGEKILKSLEKNHEMPNRVSAAFRCHVFYYKAMSQLELQKYEEAEAINEQMLQAAKESEDDNLMARAYNSIGRTHACQGEFEEAAGVWEKMIPLAKDPKLQTWLFHELGRCRFQLRQFPEAVSYAGRCVRSALTCGRALWSLRGHLLLGQAHAALDNPQEALDAFRIARRVARHLRHADVQRYLDAAIETLKTDERIAKPKRLSKKQISFQEQSKNLISKTSDAESVMLNMRDSYFKRVDKLAQRINPNATVSSSAGFDKVNEAAIEVFNPKSRKNVMAQTAKMIDEKHWRAFLAQNRAQMSPQEYFDDTLDDYLKEMEEDDDVKGADSVAVQNIDDDDDEELETYLQPALTEKVIDDDELEPNEKTSNSALDIGTADGPETQPSGELEETAVDVTNTEFEATIEKCCVKKESKSEEEVPNNIAEEETNQGGSQTSMEEIGNQREGKSQPIVVVHTLDSCRKDPDPNLEAKIDERLITSLVKTKQTQPKSITEISEMLKKRPAKTKNNPLPYKPKVQIIPDIPPVTLDKDILEIASKYSQTCKYSQNRFIGGGGDEAKPKNRMKILKTVYSTTPLYQPRAYKRRVLSKRKELQKPSWEF